MFSARADGQEGARHVDSRDISGGLGAGLQGSRLSSAHCEASERLRARELLIWFVVYKRRILLVYIEPISVGVNLEAR